MDGGWLELSRLRIAIVLVLAGGIVLWLLQSPTNTTMISAWPGSSFNKSAGNDPKAGTAPQGIMGQAVAQGRGAGPSDTDVPYGNPLGVPSAVMTQGYGVGSHAPANVWGAIDLAVDGNGDGQADPSGTQGAPIYATHRGTIKMASNTYPAGNHVWIFGEHYKTGYSHLSGFAPGLVDGQVVDRGQLIGYVGSTGESSGPHLDYQVWKDNVNQNPLDYAALDGIKQ